MTNIANKIVAKDRKLSEILTGCRYKIDVFQREYRWQREQIEDLISDLVINFHKSYKEGDTLESYSDYDSYYMGPIVLCENSNSDLSIIDGQQRLTSFTLLLIYLNHVQNSLDLDECQIKEIKNYLYIKKGGKITLVLNIESRSKIMERIINDENNIYNDDFYDSDERPESIQNIISRYEDIKTLFPQEISNEQTLPLFIEWLLDKIVFVEVRAYSMDNAYSIFESMNNRGLSLSPAEILKGFLLSKIVENNPENEEKAEEANVFWSIKIQQLRRVCESDNCDLDFFRAWLRGKYAETQRTKKIGSENEDFEIIGTQFNSWVKNNLNKINLKQSDDFYYFIMSDLEFFINLYIKIYNSQNNIFDFLKLYVCHFYTIANSLIYPLYISSISKIDTDIDIYEKIILITDFIDKFTNIRSIQGKTITQSSIRTNIYELVKQIRNLDYSELKIILNTEIIKNISDGEIFRQSTVMNNYGYYSYFFARILYAIDEDYTIDFVNLLRSRRRNSYTLIPIITSEDVNSLEDDRLLKYYSLVSNYVLVRRPDVDDVHSVELSERISLLKSKGYLPEMINYNPEDNICDFMDKRYLNISSIVKKIWG